MEYFNQFKTASAFAKGFNVQEDAWSELVSFMSKAGVDMQKVSANDKKEIEKRIKTWMARQIFRMQGYYEVNNLYDRAVMRAMEEIRK
jgi:carboxyl-terminal processing protease